MAVPTTTARGLADQLALSEARFSLAFEGAPIGIALVATDGTFLRANPALCALLGYSEDQLRARTFQGLTHPDDLQRDLDLLQQVLAGEIPTYRIHKRYIRADGRLVHAQLDVALVRDEDDEPLYFISQVQDITERTAVLDALRRAEATQRASLDALEQAVLLVTVGGHIEVANAACERILGFRCDELAVRYMGPDWVTFREDGTPMPLEERPVIRTFLTGQPVHEQVIESRHADGRPLTLRISTQPVLADDGTVASVVAAFTDITEQREAERARAAAEAALRRTNAWYSALVERSTDIVCVVDAEGHILYVSPAGEAMWGSAASGAVGLSFLRLVHRDDRTRVGAELDDLVSRPGHARTTACRLSTGRSQWRHVEIVATNRLADPDVAGIVANVRDVTERAEAAARLSWQAFHDPLTGLPNRALLTDRLGQAVERSRRHGERAALLFLDVDRFKVVNDTMGHEAGDQLLVQLAERIVGAVRPSDTVARLGGDEFVVLTESGTDPADIAVMAERIGAAVAQPVALAAGEITVSSSIGIAFDSGGEPGALLRDADMALYRAKERGKDRYEIFDDSLRVAALNRLALERELREALERDALAVHFQPIVDLETGRVHDTEALLRLPAPGGTVRSPVDHMDVADESGLIVPIGDLVLDRSCAALARWRQELGEAAPGRVAVNVAGRQLASVRYTATVSATLERHGLDPSDLVLEFTESTVIDAGRSTRATVHGLHEMGVRLAVDDFGTGYSSLAYLKRFPIRIVKIDRTFVSGLGVDRSDTEIVRAVTSLAEALGIDVVAEGIETAHQLAALREVGCRLGQGYLLARPAPADALADQLPAIAAALGA